MKELLLTACKILAIIGIIRILVAIVIYIKRKLT